MTALEAQMLDVAPIASDTRGRLRARREISAGSATGPGPAATSSARVDEMSLDGQVYWSAHPPGVSYPSDANEVSPGRYIAADYSYPGQVVIFSRTGHVVWRFRPSGAAALNHPSLAMPLPNGDILVNDDYTTASS